MILTVESAAAQRSEGNKGRGNMISTTRKNLRVALWLSILCAVLVPATHARTEQSVIFASVADGRRILTARDSFVERMSPFDRAARMKTDHDISESEFLAFVGKTVLNWDGGEKNRVQSALRLTGPALSQFFPAHRESIYLIKTTGDEEAGAAYTRGNAIVLPRNVLTLPEPSFRHLLAHEFFHILSRSDPRLRRMLYEAIGFHECGEVELPAVLSPRKITNPDALKNDHCIQVGVAGELVWAMPILYSRTPKYDVASGGKFFDYLMLALMVVERSGPSGAARPIFGPDGPTLVGIDRVSGFFEQIGRNTRYIIHPEEILAENVALLVLGEKNAPSPEVLKRIAEALERGRVTEPGPAKNAPQPSR